MDAAMGLFPAAIELEGLSYEPPYNEIYADLEGVIGEAFKAATNEERRRYLQILNVATWAVFQAIVSESRIFSDKARTIHVNSINKETIRQLFLDKMFEDSNELAVKLILERDREKVLINAWIGYHQTGREPAEDDPLFWACEELFTVAQEAPDRAIDLISKICAEAESEKVLANLGAGPTEDLLVYNGNQVADQVADKARQDPKFARMLSNVWGDGIDKEVWDKIRPLLKFENSGN
ncbi:hypothetical protein GUA87_04835 [Sneathiella sp. P13V-1]|uniref:DUF6869 domain-containing protein n=1 Tax=Sneathiella sp. P13V-1 TaxID=2697366 RepID=UPI00187BB926|nr:hypothetical protein [Sneathiella sp. P13V-1]MBE7636159.1 hypothetical protein [Sneathiella sp. P13V-1]